jgi:hypothetical protein
MIEQERITDYWSSVRDIIDKVCIDYDASWKKRNRVLNSKIIILMIFKIILSDRNRGLTINLTEFWDRCAEKDIDLPQTKPATDGSRINIPHELVNFGFKIYDEECRHYPQGLLSCLYDVLNKTIYDFGFVSHMNERK